MISLLKYLPPYWNTLYSKLRKLSIEEWEDLIKVKDTSDINSTESSSLSLNYMSTAKDISNMKGRIESTRQKIKEQEEAEAKAKADADAKKKGRGLMSKLSETTKSDDDKSNDTPTEDYVPKGTSNVSEKLEGSNITVDGYPKTVEIEDVIDAFKNTVSNSKQFNKQPTDKVKTFTLRVDTEGMYDYQLKSINYIMDRMRAFTNENIKAYNVKDIITVVAQEKSLSDLGVKLEDNSSKENDAETDIAA